MDLEEVWRIREEEVYPSLFGPHLRGLAPLSAEFFSRYFGCSNVDARWLFMGVFEFAPQGDRNHWIYVTSGYSTPWEDLSYDPNGQSGSGVEFCFAVTEQGDWAIHMLQFMLAGDLMISAGLAPSSTPLTVYDRIPMRAPVNGDPACRIRNLMLTEREDGPSQFALPSGQVKLLSFTGITDDELTYAKAHGSRALVDALRSAGHHPVTDPRRESIF